MERKNEAHSSKPSRRGCTHVSREITEDIGEIYSSYTL